MIRFIAFVVILVSLSCPAQAQKVKYKELFVLLNASQFETAETHLKRYLQENTDNPNAFYFMGVTYQEKAQKIDPLINTDQLLATMDSAIFFLDKAFKTIDERELKKNDEYYESFSRRDIRTGKFTVKLSDIQLQLEERVKGLRGRSDRVKLMKMNFVKASSAYQRAVNDFKKLTEPFADERDLLLRSNEDAPAALKALGESYDSSLYFFNQYKGVSQLVGKTGHNQVLDVQEIKDMKRNGQESVDFLQEGIRVWDYKSWSIRIADLLTREIAPMRARMVAYDIEINKLRELQKKDSVSVSSEIKEINKRLSQDNLWKLDPSPLPMGVFEMNLSELSYTSDLITNRKIIDSLNVKQKLDIVRSELKSISKVDSVAKLLEARDLDKEGLLYYDYVTKTYGTLSVLKSNIKSSQDYASREKIKREKEWERISQTLKWVISGSDSIPLFAEDGKILGHRPVIVVSEDHTAGLKFADTLATGYFYTITPTRLPDVKASFTVDASVFKKRNLPLIKGISTRDATSAIYFILLYSEGKSNDKFPATLAKINRVDGLAWNINIGFELTPSELYYSKETGELSVKITGTGGESKIVTLDKNGNVVQ